MVLMSRHLVALLLFAITIWVSLKEPDGHNPNLNLRIRSDYELDSPNYFLDARYLTAVTTDDHATAPTNHEASTHPSLFEALTVIHVEIGTFAVLTIIGFIILLKQLIEALYALTHESAFHGMVKKIEEELMIVGSSSFIFKIVLNTTNFGTNIWAYPLEFGEVLVPLIAFSYCGIGVLLIVISFKQCYTWSRAHNLKVMEILDDYFEASKTWYFYLSWKPMNKSIEQMEFRIYHNLFCSAFKIQKGAFAFDEYVAKVFQRSVYGLIEIRLLDWFYVTVLLLLNLARVKLNLQLRSCEHGNATCDSKRTILLFTLVGTIIFLFTFLLLIVSRRLEFAIMGVKSHLHYAQFIQLEDMKNQADGARMDVDQLKIAAAKASGDAREEPPLMRRVTTLMVGKLKISPVNKLDSVGEDEDDGERVSLSLTRPGDTTQGTSAADSCKTDRLESDESAPLDKKYENLLPLLHPSILSSLGLSNINTSSAHSNHDENSSSPTQIGATNSSSPKDSDKVSPFKEKPFNNNNHDKDGKDSDKVSPFKDKGVEEEDDEADIKSLSSDFSVSTESRDEKDDEVETNMGQKPSFIVTAEAAAANKNSVNKNNNNYSSNNIVDSKISGSAKVKFADEVKSSSPSTSAPTTLDGMEQGSSNSTLVTPAKNDQIRKEEKTQRLSKIKSGTNPTFGQHSKDMKNVFLFSSPELYFESVQILFMVISFYAALWFTVMASSSHSGFWKFLSICPAVLICCFFFYIVKTAALLKAVYVVDVDVMLEVIEETEAAKQLSSELRAKVLERLDATGEDPFTEIERLYNEIDVNGNDSLSRTEFGQFMELMGISFSTKKWEKIYKEIDRNYDNEISLQEFLLFLYPNHDMALSMEQTRLKIISQRVMDRANNLLSHLSPFADMIGERRTSVTNGRRNSVAAIRRNGMVNLPERTASGHVVIPVGNAQPPV